MATYTLNITGRFKKDLKAAKKRGLDIQKLNEVVFKLIHNEALPPHHHNHRLHGDYQGYWECHITPDWLLIYEKDVEIRIITLYRTGTHSDLFGK